MCSGGNENILAVIPARFVSTRFPGKIVAPLAGKPLVARAYERACQAKLVSEAIVATDDERVVTALEPLGIPVVETEYEGIGVDTPEDLERVRKVFE